MSFKILPQIQGPDSLRKLTVKEMELLASELRETIIDTVSKNGGHLAPNLGVVELTIALHRVFHVPEDKVVWDVSHQCYAHKLLTGRAPEFYTIRKFGGISGFTRRDESPCDSFGSGHAGTSISAAMGMEAASELTGRHNHNIAVVGDGSLVCGISLEALNNLRSTCKNMIIILNDNKMSIAPSIGAIPNYLNRIITGRGYNRFKAFSKVMLQKMPGGQNIVNNIQNLESSLKNLFVPGLFFEEMGIRYIGPIDGHSLPELIKTFEHVRDFNRPVLVHVITQKGHGCDYAAAAPEKYHGIGSFRPDTGASIYGQKLKETFSAAFGKKLFKMAEKDERIVAVTAAMASGCGITEKFTSTFPHRFFDVGIAEEHAIVFASGMAMEGLRPIVAIYATFLQRALDCICHDVCLQNLPVVICADRAGIVEDGPTHHGIYDISYLRSIPNMSILAPRNEKELGGMMDAAVAHSTPVIIRYPRGNSGAPERENIEPVVWGKSEILKQGGDLVIWTYSRDCYIALETVKILEEKYQLDAGVVNTRFLRPFDKETFLKQARTLPVVTIEDNVTTGGLASIAAETLVGHKNCGLKSFGWSPDIIIHHGATVELRKQAGLYPEKLAADIAAWKSDKASEQA